MMKEMRVGLVRYIIYKKVGATIIEPCGTPQGLLENNIY